MWAVAVAVVLAIALWWSSTVLVMYLDGMRSATHRWSMLAATLVAAAGVLGLAAAANDTSVVAAYQAFVCALAVWGWNELAFLTGFLTGPRRVACSERCHGWTRFRHACAAIAYHEIGLLFSLAIVLSVSAGGVNRTGIATFVALWLMRLSSKLNLFFGVPNVGEELLPDGLKYLRSFFRHRPMNPLFPVSVTALTLATAHLIYTASGTEPPGERTALVLLAALVALGTLEHWLLVLPIPSTALWRAGLRSREHPPHHGVAGGGDDEPLPAAGRRA